MSARKEGTPDPSWQDVDLLDCVDDCLRNGRLMTRGNLAFELLLGRFGYERRDLPGYAADMAELEAENAAELAARKLEEEDAAFGKTVNPFPNHHGGLRP